APCFRTDGGSEEMDAGSCHADHEECRGLPLQLGRTFDGDWIDHVPVGPVVHLGWPYEAVDEESTDQPENSNCDEPDLSKQYTPPRSVRGSHRTSHCPPA